MTAEVLDAAPQPEGGRARRDRPRQRRRRGRDAPRRDGRERAAVQHRSAPPSTRSRCCSRRRGTSRRRTRALKPGVGTASGGRASSSPARRSASSGSAGSARSSPQRAAGVRDAGDRVRPLRLRASARRRWASTLMPTLESLLVQSDFVSIHLPRTPDTEGLIGEHELAMMKQGARLVNTARGGIVDEEALAKALEDGRLAGAALDVFAEEPTTDSPLFGLDQVVVTPHLGASTTKRRTRRAPRSPRWSGSRSKGEFVPYAVNVSAGAEVSETVRPFVAARGAPRSLVDRARARAASGRSSRPTWAGSPRADTRVLTLAILKGILGRSVHEPVSFVNAPMLARDRGLTVSEMRSTVLAGLRQPDLPARRDRRRVRITVGGHAARQEGRRTRHRRSGDFDIEIDARASTCSSSPTRTARASSARSGRSSASTTSTSRRWRSGRKAAGGDALMGSRSTRRCRPTCSRTRRRRDRRAPRSAPSRCDA